ncbi:MAG: chromosome segregation protein SMC, partial [Nitrospinae bacterium]|nr:chromosome segregation protein SMC [Nitrospinota bacterium]
SISIISQGQIEALISAKPEERRVLIEEAAGVVKYKSRRHEATLKLNNTRENIVRLQDIVEEVDKNVRRLKGQASKATRAKTYNERIAALTEKELSIKYKEALYLFENIEEQKKKLEDERLEFEVRFNKTTSQVEKGRQKVTESEQEYYKVTEKVIGKKHEIESSTGKLTQNEEKEQDLENTILENEKKISTLMETNEEINERNNEKQQLLDELQNQSQVEENKQQELKKNISAFEEQLRNKEKGIEEKEKKLFSMMHEISAINNEVSSLEKGLSLGKERKNKLENELSNIAGDEKKNKEALENTQKETEKNQKERNNLDKNIEESRNSLVENETALNELNDIVSQGESELIRLKSRFHTLESIVKEHDDLPGDIKKLFHHFKEDVEKKNMALFVDEIEVQAGFEVQLENYFGDTLHSVLVHNEKTFGEIVSHHNEHALKGNYFATFVDFPKTKNETISLKEAIPFVSYVSSKNKKVHALLQSLLKNVYYVETIHEENINELKQFNGKTFVSSNSTIFEADGRFSSHAAVEESDSVFIRRKELQELSQEIETLTKKKEKNVKSLEKLRSDVAKRREVLHQYMESHKAIDILINRNALDQEGLEREKERLKQLKETVDFELNQNKEEEKENLKRVDELKNNLADIEKEKETFEAGFKELKQQIRDENEKLNSLKENFNVLNLEKHRLEGKIQLILVEISNNEKDIKNNIDTIEELKNDKKHKKELIEKLKKENTEIKELLAVLVKDLEAAQEEEIAIKNSLETIREELRKLEEEEAKVGREMKEVSQKIEDILMNRGEARSKVVNLENQIVEKTIMTPEDIKKMEVEEELQSILSTKEGEERKLRELGEINYAAIEEFEEESERLEFLNKQIEDLQEAIDNIEETISKIDTSTKKMFMETYTKVNQNFQELFKEVFEGGEASLELSEPNNILETGIHIIARPPGKKLQYLTLLSSGEKAMTTLSLLFAVFMERPAPFCFLDEVDAPLDEINIHRFVNLIKQFTEKTQFVLISHNQRTISFADILYGVTMEEQGVSKVVSVDLNQMVA